MLKKITAAIELPQCRGASFKGEGFLGCILVDAHLSSQIACLLGKLME